MSLQSFKDEKHLRILAGLLLVVYLCKDSSDPETIHFQTDKRKDGSQTKPPARNSSYPYSWLSCQQNMCAANITNVSSHPDSILSATKTFSTISTDDIFPCYWTLLTNVGELNDLQKSSFKCLLKAPL